MKTQFRWLAALGAAASSILLCRQTSTAQFQELKRNYFSGAAS